VGQKTRQQTEHGVRDEAVIDRQQHVAEMGQRDHIARLQIAW
jgi:hypothetical protein